MSAVAVEPDPGEGASQDDLLLTAVKVEFRNKRPKGKLRLYMMLNDEEYQVEIDKGEAVQWLGSVRCTVPSTITICVRHLERSLFHAPLLRSQWKEFASVQAPISSGLQHVTDLQQRMTASFTISAYRETPPPVSTATPVSSDLDVLAKAKAAKERIEKKQVIVDKLGKVWKVLDAISGVGEALSDIHPAIGVALSIVGALKAACEKQESCRDEALELVGQFDPFLSIGDHMEELKQRTETRRAVETMSKLIERISQYILDHTSHSIIGNLFGEEYREKLGEMKAEFTRAKEAFDRSVQLEVFKAVAGIQLMTQLNFIRESLSECKNANFKSGKDDVCLEGTRVGLHTRAVNWMEGKTDPEHNVFWLQGQAGSGKSTVANTVAKTAEDRGYYLSCFCCRRDSADLSNPLRVLPTLAYRFAVQHESYRATMVQLIQSGSRGADNATSTDIETQFDTLFKGPLTQTVDPLRPHVIVVDALDECGTSKDQARLAKYLLQLSHLAPWIKVFVTSRDETAIRKVFTEVPCVQCNINEETDTNQDIRQYIQSQAESLECKVSGEDIEQLVQRAEGLFIWCSTLFKYLGTRTIPRDALEPFLSREERHESWSQLYQLYDRVLDLAAQDQEDVAFMRTLLETINVASRNRPLSAQGIVSFLNYDERRKERYEQHVQTVVKKLHAVLYVDHSTNGAIRAYHTSFYDFLERKAAEAVPGWERLEMTHCRMFQGCMSVLNAQLRFNICGIQKPVLNADILDLSERISKNISEELQYSSQFWFTHLSPSNLAPSAAAPGVRELLCSRKLLFWLEALSLQGSLMQYAVAFAACSSFFQGYPDIVVAANDAHRFVSTFSEAMHSVPHIYMSSLFWLPEDSQTYRNLELSELAHRQLIKGKENHWDAVIWERSVDGSLWCVAHSPDGRYIACGSDNDCIYILNAHTGAQEGEPLQGHSWLVTCLAYSPNGQFIASCSGDHTVRIWDARSGEPVFEPLVGHAEWVGGVAWSPDGQSIASCSNDGTIRIWSTRTGAQLGEPLRGHEGEVWAVAYAPDGKHIVSGGKDGTVRVWRTDTSQEVEPSFCRHSDPVRSVRYSPGSRAIVSGSSDGTIRIWNAQTGEAIGQPLQGHTDWVQSVMYSPNGQLIVSGSRDCTVKVWDAVSGMCVGGPLRVHAGLVRSVSCSPDGLSIASVSDNGTIRLWEMPTGPRTREQPQVHDGTANAIAFSPDGHHIVTGSDDHSVRVWDAETGAPVGEPLRGHEGKVRSVAYSPDGESIASGSYDGTVRIWNAKTGEAIGEPLRGHSRLLESVAYSPNGCLIASASWDGTVRLWDARTGRAIGEPLQAGHWALSVAFSPDSRSLACGTSNSTILVWGISSTPLLKMTLRGHSHWVNSVTFSPNGRYIASGSDDKTVRIWDAQTGESRGSPLEDHTGRVLCVAFSPDSRLIASGSFYGTICLWDVQTGRAVEGPLRKDSAAVLSMAFSPDGRSFASTREYGRICVYTLPSTHPSRDFSETEARARWLKCCSHMDKQTGWVKDGDSLLLWTPLPYRPIVVRGARILIDSSAPRVVACNVDYETLFRYSGTAWVNVLSDTSCN